MSRVKNFKGAIRYASGATAQPDTTNAKTGDIWFNTTHNALMVFDGTAWRGRVLTSTSTSTTSSSTTTS